MARQEYTPGPWQYRLAVEDNVFIVADSQDEQLARVTGTKKHFQSNARLMAASPDLLAACKSIERDGADWLSDEACKMLRNAITKAEKQ